MKYRYLISGQYTEDGEAKNFCEEIEAEDNFVAMDIVCGQIFRKADGFVKLDFAHYEVLKNRG